MSTDRTIDIEKLHEQIWDNIATSSNTRSAKEDLGLSKFETQVYYAYMGIALMADPSVMRELLEKAKSEDKITDAVYNAILKRTDTEKEDEDVNQQNTIEV